MIPNRLTTKSLAPFWENAMSEGIAKSSEIDISSFRFVTPDALVGLCSLIEYILSKRREKCIIFFPEIPRSFSTDLLLLQKLRNADQKSASYEYTKRGIAFNYEEFKDAQNILKYLSFFHNIGFTRIWANERKENEVTLSQFPTDQLEHLFVYKGQKIGIADLQGGTFRRYSSIHRIEGTSRQRRDIIETIIEEMEERLPSDQLNSPMFEDKEFDDVFVSQLAENVAAHTDSRGYIIVRSFSKEDLKRKDYRKTILPSCSSDIEKRCVESGFFEISIADCGPGICDTLRDAYHLVREDIMRYRGARSPKESISDIDVMQFALDEIGSRFLKVDDEFEALINSHTLNLIYQYTRKYGGSLRILSRNICLSFDTCGKIKRGKYGLGFLGRREAGKWFHSGLNLRAILPHRPRSIKNYPKRRKILWPESLPSEKQIPNFWYVESELGDKPKMDTIKSKALELSQTVFKKNIDYLALDFSGTENSLNTKLFIYFLRCIENIMSHIHCWGVNVSDTLLESLSTLYSSNEEIEMLNDNRLGFLCLDNSPEREPHFVSKDLLKLSDGLSILLGSDDMPPDSEPIFHNIDDLIINLRHTSKIYLEADELLNILSRHPHLFVSDEKGDMWRARIDILRMRISDALIMRNNFRRHLEETNSVFKGKDPRTGKIKLFQLPSTNKTVKEYIWTYNLFQQGQFTEEMARRLKYAIENYIYQETGSLNALQSLGGILCLTAPARILAEAMARLFVDSPPVLDLGTFTDFDTDDVMSSFGRTGNKTCIVVTDVLDSKGTLAKMVRRAEKANIEVIAAAAIIRFSESRDAWIEKAVPITFDQLIKKGTESNIYNKKQYPTAILYDYPSPEEESYNPEKHKLYWIEPYSLRPFPIETLTEASYAWEDEEQKRNIPKNICLLDQKGCILYGHFKDRNHHNRILIHMRRALKDPEIAYKICNDIIEFASPEMPSVIVVPLHSHIHEILSNLKILLREESHHIPIICTIAVDLRGRGPYYLLPEEAQNILMTVTSKRLMFLDDGILSGRTVETFLRAVSHFLKTVNKNKPKKEIITLESIYIYCIVNRVGRAASTKWREISSLFEKTRFIFQEFIRFECPVFTSHDCPLCRDSHRLDEYLQDRGGPEKRINKWIRDQQSELAPIVLGTRAYREVKTDHLNVEQSIPVEHSDFLAIDTPVAGKTYNGFYKEYYRDMNDLRVQTVQGALWWFWERSYRGTPPIFLLERFAEWTNSHRGPKGIMREKLFTEVLFWALDNMNHLRKGAYDKNLGLKEPIPEIFFDLFKSFLYMGSDNISRVLEKAAYVLTLRDDDESAIEYLFNIFEYSLEALSKSNNVVGASSTILGLYLIILRTKKVGLFNEFLEACYTRIEEYSKSENLSRGYFRNLMNFIFVEASNDDFMSSLALLCRERYKAPHHKTVLSEKIEDILDKSTPTAKFGYLADAVPQFMSSLETVFKGHLEITSKVSEEIELVKIWCKAVCEIIERPGSDGKRIQLYNALKEIEHHICDNTDIGQLLDAFNPIVSDVIDEVKKEYYEVNRSVNRKGKIELNEIEGINISILGDRSLFKSMLSNHTSAVLEKHSISEHNRIKIRVFETGDTIHVSVLNSWIEPKKAKDLIASGNTFANEKLFWERFKAKFTQPEDADEQGFKSKMVFEFQKGYLKGDENG